ncbi:MAG: hypothetical protein R3199_07595 [Gemmatimonadota bacterium]|nr:hypothetical protein [Gemmatimonadota bacterium]
MNTIRLASLASLLTVLLAGCDGEEGPRPDEVPAADTAARTWTDTVSPDTTASVAVDTVPVDAADVPGASGALFVRQGADSLRLELVMTGLEPDVRYLPNVHEGACGGPMGPAVGSLPPVTGGGADTVRTTGALDLSKLAAGRSYFLELHGLGTAACVDLPLSPASPPGS